MLKIPYNIAGRKADYTNSRDWMTFQAAYTMLARGRFDGLGIVIDSRFGIVGYDADSCISNGTISVTAREHIATLNSYTEESFSGTGLHCLAYGALRPKGRKSDRFEMYCDRRFFVVTGATYRARQREIARALALNSAAVRKILSRDPNLPGRESGLEIVS